MSEILEVKDTARELEAQLISALEHSDDVKATVCVTDKELLEVRLERDNFLLVKNLGH